MYEDRGRERRPGARNSKFGPIPVKEGDTYDVEIEGIGEKGDGIAKINGYVIIVPNVQKGQKVKVKINAVRGKVSFGEVIGDASVSEDESSESSEEESESDEESEEEDFEESEQTDDASDEEK